MRWADSCMGGITKSDVLENSFHAEQYGSPSPCLSCCPPLPHTRAVSPWVPVIHGEAHSLSPMPQLPLESHSPARAAVSHTPWPHRCPASGASWAFSGLGNGVGLCGTGLTGAGLSACTFPASLHGQGRFSPPAESRGSLEAEYLRVSLGRRDGSCLEKSGGDFYLDYLKLL